MFDITIQPDAISSFQGVITALNEKYPQNWNNFVKIKPSSTNPTNGRDGAQSLINRSIHGSALAQNWCSYSRKDENIILSFPTFYIEPSFYSLQAKTIETHFPSSWKIESSMNMREWTLIDQKDDRDELSTNSANITFPFQKTIITKYIKITQTKAYNENSYHFCLRQLEIFGTIHFSLKSCFQCPISILKRIPFSLVFQLT